MLSLKAPFPTRYKHMLCVCTFFSGESVVPIQFLNENMTKEVKNHCSRLRNGNNRLGGSKSSIYRDLRSGCRLEWTEASMVVLGAFPQPTKIAR